MPVYEYECQDCGTRFEKLVRLGDSSGEVVCPKCQSEAVERLISVFGRVGSSLSSSSWSPGST